MIWRSCLLGRWPKTPWESGEGTWPRSPTFSWLNTSMVAYTSKSGEVLSRLVDLPASLSGNLFTLLMALLVLLEGNRITDQVNRWLTASMIGLPTIFLGSPSPLPHLLDKRSIHSFIHSYVYRFIGDHRVCGHLVWWWIISNGDIQLGEGSNNNPGDHLLTRVS